MQTCGSSRETSAPNPTWRNTTDMATVLKWLSGIQLQRLSQACWHLNRLTLGRYFSIFRGNLGYAWWRLRNRQAPFSSYYAASITRKLDQGKPHRTLGRKRHGPTNFLAGGEHLLPSNAQQHGSFAFKRILRLGLRPHHLCVDFGCGSLRIGQHLIEYLEPRRYYGLDITDRFYRDGLELLENGVMEAKHPYLAVIQPATLRYTTHLKPDYLISVSVVMHIPPSELDSFFHRLLGLMAPHTRVLLFFDESPVTVRTEAKSWAYSVPHLKECILNQLPDAQVACETGSKTRGQIAKAEFRRSVLIIEGGKKKKPALPKSHHAALVSDTVLLRG